MLAFVVLGVPAVAWMAQEGLIFFPQPVTSTSHIPARAARMEVRTAEGQRVRGWMIPGTAVPGPTVIYFGGNAEEVSWTAADTRWPREWTVVAFNYRGYGFSDGKPGEAELLSDALAIFDSIAARPDIDARRIVVFGRSLGTAIAARVAAERPVAGVILVSPYDSLVEIGRHHYPFLPVSLLLRHRFEAARDAARSRTPVLVMVAENDSIIPDKRSRALFDRWLGPKSWQVIPRTDHNSLGASDAYWQNVGAFLAER